MLYQWDIIGHQKNIERLEDEIQQDNISHAYLFSGPKEVGKHRIARTFASILQCPNGYCKKCETCRLIEKGSHPDTIILRDNGESIKIDEVRRLIKTTNLTAQSRYRVVIIEYLERMPVEAQNSFLKTLEEPTGKTIFLLTSSKTNKILPTIKSRVRQYSFLNISNKVIEDYLKKKFDNSGDLNEIIQIAQGRPGLAIKLIQNPTELNEQRNLYKQIATFLEKNDLVKKFNFIEVLEEDPKKLEEFFDAFSRYLRKLLFDYLNNDDLSLKSRFSLKDIANLFESLEKTRYLIGRNVNKKLALENFFLATEK